MHGDPVQVFFLSIRVLQRRLHFPFQFLNRASTHVQLLCDLDDSDSLCQQRLGSGLFLFVEARWPTEDFPMCLCAG